MGCPGTYAGLSVVVCAPTGAGKTAIAEAAAVAVLARGQRVIYTTPLKALSNQKLHEMRERFGAARVGLQTGDGSLNIGVLHSLAPRVLHIPRGNARACTSSACCSNGATACRCEWRGVNARHISHDHEVVQL